MVLVKHTSESQEWYTPKKIIESARVVMGKISLDPASCSLANRNVQANFYFSEIGNGLDKDWDVELNATVWLNPPYNNTLNWVKKAVTELEENRVNQVCLLVKPDLTNKWGKIALNNANAICFFESRIKFLRQEGGVLVPGKSPAHGNIVFYFGPHYHKFEEEFSKYGKLLKI